MNESMRRLNKLIRIEAETPAKVRTKFDGWTNDQLDAYIFKHNKILFDKQGIECIEDADEYYSNQMEDGLISWNDKVIEMESAVAYFTNELNRQPFQPQTNE